MKISSFAIRVASGACVVALATASAQAAEPVASHHRVTPPPKPIVETQVMPGIPEPERMATEQGKGRARGFDTRRHRSPSGEYIRD